MTGTRRPLSYNPLQPLRDIHDKLKDTHPNYRSQMYRIQTLPVIPSKDGIHG